MNYEQITMISPVKLWRNQRKVREFIGKQGVVISWTIIRVPPQGFESQAPYPVALVNLGERQEIGQLVDVALNGVKVGQKVKAVVRRVRQPDHEGVIPYGIKFVPIEEAAK